MSSTIYTIGTALRRAQDSGLPVRVLVEGHWFDGQVAGVDGDGLVLVSDNEQAVVRMTAISVVRVQSGLSDPVPPSTPEPGVYEAGPVSAFDDTMEDLVYDAAVVTPRREHVGAVEAQRRMLAVLSDR